MQLYERGVEIKLDRGESRRKELWWWSERKSVGLSVYWGKETPRSVGRFTFSRWSTKNRGGINLNNHDASSWLTLQENP